MTIVIKFCKLNEVPTPRYYTDQSAGLDLCASVSKPVYIKPNAIKLLSTGLILDIPEGFEGQIRPRSGLALKYGVTVLNAPGTIDSDYIGECKILLVNHGSKEFKVTKNMRIAQLVLKRYEKVELKEVSFIRSKTMRNNNGFGSTGYY